MILNIRHQTDYRYTAAVAYTIQQLRLTPRREPTQHTLNWKVTAPGRCHVYTDAWGNATHVLTVTGDHMDLRVVAEGRVQTIAPDRGRILGNKELHPLVFTVPTALTEATDTVLSFATRHLQAGARSHALLDLATAIQAGVAYQAGATGVFSTASEALLLGQGVCQDHAHLFIACCHSRNIPARYVSGYLDAGGADHAATHAWVDAWVEEVDYSGWVSIDVTHAIFQDERYCRIAVGRDYESAAPVRGVRRGGGTEAMSVDVTVTPEGMR